MRLLPAAAGVLAVQGGALPQADHSCGPFAAHAALHAVLPAADVPSPAELARACRTRSWPADGPASRPPGEPAVPGPGLPQARRPSESGTDADGLRRGIEAATAGAVAVVPAAPGPGAGPSGPAIGRLLDDLASAAAEVGVIAHVRTGPLVAGTAAAGWDVGHFVCVVGRAPDPGAPDGVVLADSYPSVGEAGWPPGCRPVPLAALDAAVRAAPGRGLLLLVPAGRRGAAVERVRAAGLLDHPWST